MDSHNERPTVEVLSGIREIPVDVWQELAPPDDPMWAWQVFDAMERGAIGVDRFGYAVLREGARISAVLPMSGQRALRLENVVGPRERRLLAPVVRWAPRTLGVPMLFCGHFIGQGHLLAREPLSGPALEALVAAALGFARRHRLGTVVFKDFGERDLTPLRPALHAHGFFFAPALPDTELALGHGSFDAYLAALPAKPRRNARRNIRVFEDSGLRMEMLTAFGPLLPDMLGLYRQVMDRADQVLDVIDGSFLRALQEADGLDERLVACFEGRRLVGYLHCFLRGRGMVAARIGMDYRLAHAARLYHNLHYAAIALGIAEGREHIRFAQTAYEPKREMGCVLVEQSYAMTHLRPLPRAALRALLPAALRSAHAEALAPRS
ncbi:GNAT family N-acetyltransferase [Streptomyces sp. SL13]|uniref:GNAT family N-acetyltransferase n=1 Tax=Streptantibioticus silvisoli TaxID=2705255 RepID=A0AA90K974_9ACTN|nr:GNAT family N-acetyltransferase [Streptantibioticus silvisoli]MDI5970783.1 GNAT family N-acetyltransferase [Streptantibioticus silvisoli]